VNAIIADLQKRVFAQPQLHYEELIEVEKLCKKIRFEDSAERWEKSQEVALKLEEGKKALEEAMKDVKRRIEQLQEGLEEVERVDLNGDVRKNMQRFENAVVRLHDFVTGKYRSDLMAAVFIDMYLSLLQSREKAKEAEKKNLEGGGQGDKVQVDIDSLVAQLRGLDDTITDIQVDQLIGETAKLLRRKAKQVYSLHAPSLPASVSPSCFLPHTSLIYVIIGRIARGR
jgi:predicted nuclease with TOPRIM domain